MLTEAVHPDNPNTLRFRARSGELPGADARGKPAGSTSRRKKLKLRSGAAPAAPTAGAAAGAAAAGAAAGAAGKDRKLKYGSSGLLQLTVALTGARAGDVLAGISPDNNGGVVLKVVSGEVKVSAKIIRSGGFGSAPKAVGDRWWVAGGWWVRGAWWLVVGGRW